MYPYFTFRGTSHIFCIHIFSAKKNEIDEKSRAYYKLLIKISSYLPYFIHYK